MDQTYLRIPRFHRLEYLDALLRSYDGENFNEVNAKTAVQLKIQEYEQKKANALRRQRPRFTEGSNTLTECIEFAQQLGLINRNKKLLPKAYEVLNKEKQRQILLESVWAIYPRFRKVMVVARENQTLDLPFYDWDEYRKNGGEIYDLDMDRKNFEIIRDFATQLGLINWYPSDNKRQIVYPTACIAMLTEVTTLVNKIIKENCISSSHQCIEEVCKKLGILKFENGCYRVENDYTCLDQVPQGIMVLHVGLEKLYIKDHLIDILDFEQMLWSEYLKLADMVPMSPVIYPQLRNQVCNKLRITDKEFDKSLISLIYEPKRLNVRPIDGTLNYSSNLAHLGKFLPPQTSEGNFIVYLKIERRG